MKPSVLLLLLVCAGAHAQAPRQDAAAMQKTAEAFLQAQTAGLPGQITISVKKVDTRALPEACPALQAFLPGSSKAWGDTTIGLRCAAPKWERYVRARVSIVGDYVTAAVPLAFGQTVTAAQLAKARGELTALPRGVLTDPADAEGRIMRNALQAGAPLRADMLRAQTVIQQGQTVQVISSGKGFRISTEARALGNGIDGQLVQVRTQAGKQLSGIARPGGIVEIAN